VIICFFCINVISDICRCMAKPYHYRTIIEPVRDFEVLIVLIVKCACVFIENELMNEISWCDEMYYMWIHAIYVALPQVWQMSVSNEHATLCMMCNQSSLYRRCLKYWREMQAMWCYRYEVVIIWWRGTYPNVPIKRLNYMPCQITCQIQSLLDSDVHAGCESWLDLLV